VLEHRVDDVCAPPCQCDDCLVMTLPLGPFALVEGSAAGVAARSHEGRVVEHVLQPLVAATRTRARADILAGVMRDWSQAGVGREMSGIGEPAKLAELDQQLSSQTHAEARQREDDLRLGMREESPRELGIKTREMFA
jgi:hypothetical protein